MLYMPTTCPQRQRLTCLQSEASAPPVPIRIHYHVTDEVREVDWDWEEWQKELPGRGRNVAKVYDLFSERRLEE